MCVDLCFDELCKQTHIVFDHLVQFTCVLMSTAKQEYIVLGHVVEFHLIYILYFFIYFQMCHAVHFYKVLFLFLSGHPTCIYGGRGGGGSAQLLLC